MPTGMSLPSFTSAASKVALELLDRCFSMPAQY